MVRVLLHIFRSLLVALLLGCASLAPIVPADGDVEGDTSAGDAASDGGCTPRCAGRECGDDGCGGRCPPGCAAGELCQAGSCRAEPGRYTLFCHDDWILSWPTDELSWSSAGPGTATIPEEAEWEASAAAFATWQAIPCSRLTFRRGPHLDEPVPPATTAIVISFEDDPLFWESACPTCLSRTSYEYDRHNFVHAVISLNSATYRWSVAAEPEPETVDVQAAVTRLLASVLGLGSPLAGADSILGPATEIGDVRERDLGRDDEQALLFLYGDPECAEAQDPGRLCCGTSCSPYCDALGAVPCR